MSLNRDHFKLLLKTTLGLILVTYVLNSRMVDFELLHSLLLNPRNLVLALLFLVTSVFLCTARWLLLVRPQGLNLSFGKLLSLTMIGAFFNTFMPGSVGGDLIKAWYVAGQEPQRRTRAVFTVVLDRMLGLQVIIFYSAFTLLFFPEWLNQNIQLRLIATLLWGFTGTSFVFALLFFTPALWKQPLFIRFLEFLRRRERLAKMIDSALLYRKHADRILLAVLVSAISVFGINIFIYLLGTSMHIPMDLPHYFFVVPLALTFSAIPLLPGGIGTGQVAFYTLFKWMGMEDPDQGSTLCTLFQVYTILFNCMGAVFYLRFKRTPTQRSKKFGFSSSAPSALI